MLKSVGSVTNSLLSMLLVATLKLCLVNVVAHKSGKIISNRLFW